MEGGEMHSEDDRTGMEKNTKRTVKTPAQVHALERLYNEDKNPSIITKKQLAESICLTEKQVAGWFCHRRLKDKRLLNGENHAIGRHDRSSGVIQDRASGHRQDSCGSTKLGEDKNFDTKEVESGRLTQQEYVGEQMYERSGNYAGNYNRMDDDTPSGSSSSSGDMSNRHYEDPVNAAISRHPIPRFPSDEKSVKTRPGPSGYLKVKGQRIENAAITAVKRQLGKHYRENGPPLGVEFDLLPPGAFESTLQDPVDETYCNEEEDLPATPDVRKVHQHPKFSKGYEYNSGMATLTPMDGTRFKATKRYEVPYNYVRQKSSETTPLADDGTYYPRRSSSVEYPEGPTRDLHGSESRDDCKTWPKQGVDRMGVVSRHGDPLLHSDKVRAERKPYNYSYPGKNIYTGENVEKTSYYAMKGSEHQNTLDRGVPRNIVKDGKAYADRRSINETRVQVPLKNDSSAPKRLRDDFPHQQLVKRTSVVDNRPVNFQFTRTGAEVPSSFSEDEASAETSYSAD